MVLFSRDDSGEKVDSRWHKFRASARRTAFDPSAFSDGDRIRYDLDTARITGQDNPRTYYIDRSIDLLGSNGTDVRDLDNR